MLSGVQPSNKQQMYRDSNTSANNAKTKQVRDLNNFTKNKNNISLDFNNENRTEQRVK